MDSLSISRVRLTNLKGFRRCDIDFSDGISSVLVSGDNGNGKSTFLRAIALGLSDEMGAYGLMSELSGSFINYAAEQAKIEIFLKSEEGEEYKATTLIKLSDKYGTERVEQSHHWKNKAGRTVRISNNEFPVYDL
ncbi:MAG: AAA family ATPase, partial [Parvularculaceae bacterium]